MKVNEKMDSGMDKGSKFGMMDQSMRDNGKNTWLMDTED